MTSKLKIVKPSRNMRNAHPYDVWKAFTRLRVLDKLAGNECTFHPPWDIAAKMYANWEDLALNEKLLVLDCKLGFTIRFLKYNSYIEEQEERHPSYYQPRKLDAYRANDSILKPIPGITGEWAEMIAHRVMDEQWGEWICRR